MTETAIWWIRNDLRLRDNPVLAAAAAADELLPVYCFDPQHYGEQAYGGTDSFRYQKTGTHRAAFQHESVADLRATLREHDSDLLIRTDPPADALAELADRVDADRIVAQRLPDPEARETERAVRNHVEAEITVETRWMHTLYHIDDLPTRPAEIDDTYTPFRKTVESNCEVRPPIETPTVGPLPESIEPDAFGEIPPLETVDESLSEPTSDDRAVLPFRGGETAGHERLASYLWETDRLREYKETRNGMLGADYSSKFSPWLSLGCLSPRYVFEEVERYEAERVANDSTYWLVFELIWRDFFQFQVAKYGRQFFSRGGLQARDDIDWRTPDSTADETIPAGSMSATEAFERWKHGNTGIPFVDANMRELNATGYLSNRGRQNVASFLVNNLRIDWRYGAAYFETQLIDYDPCSNYGNWAYIAGVGNDSRDQYFDIGWQAERYDTDGDYVKHWLSELDRLPAEYAHKPWTMTPAEQADYGVELGVDYPKPMVSLAKSTDHLE